MSCGVVSPYGVFVIETRNMDGWIFGSEKQPVWTQKFPRKSFRFQNPLRQNYKHVKAIENKSRDAGQRVLQRWHDGLHQVISRGAAQR